MATFIPAQGARITNLAGGGLESGMPVHIETPDISLHSGRAGQKQKGQGQNGDKIFDKTIFHIQGTLLQVGVQLQPQDKNRLKAFPGRDRCPEYAAQTASIPSPREGKGKVCFTFRSEGLTGKAFLLKFLQNFQMVMNFSCIPRMPEKFSCRI